MKSIHRLFVVAAALCFTVSLFADENHEIIEKVMKEGLKGKESPLAKVLDEEASGEQIKSLAELIQTMKGTRAPVGDQSEYDTKVNDMIAAMNAVAGGDDSPKALERLDNATNCKACHSDHKPKKE